MRPDCIDCGKPAGSKGGGRWHRRCGLCHKAKYNMLNLAYTLAKKEVCELCGFKPINKCQLDVDHIDGNRQNNSDDNLQTLCANCHRLKTYLNADWEEKAVNEVRSMQIDMLDNF
jgi:hypothetical protein